MRTAFQIPFDATVRVSLDTNLAMIKENPDVGPSCAISGRQSSFPLAFLASKIRFQNVSDILFPLPSLSQPIICTLSYPHTLPHIKVDSYCCLQSVRTVGVELQGLGID